VKIGIIPINIGLTGWQQIVAVAQAAEAAGFESVWTAEHVIIPETIESKYPYTEDGDIPVPADIAFYDPLITLSAIAAATNTLKLGTGVNILPQTSPLLFAKQTATLDALSGGRLLLGLGLGWMREEYQAMGTPFEARGKRFDDYLQAIRKVWSGNQVAHDSEFIQWHGFKSLPTPVLKERLPVHIGGHAGKALERAAKFGNGWFPAIYSSAELAPVLDALKNTCQQFDRDFDDLEITAVWEKNSGLDEIRRYQDLGVHRLTIPLSSVSESPLDAVQWLAENVLPAVG